jgi:hypothetical protein
MATGFLNRVLGKDEMIKAERVNLIYITLHDTKSNKNYSAKCVCGYLFNVTIYVDECLEERKSIDTSVTKQDNCCYHMLGTIYKTLGIRIDKNAPFVNVSWNCAQCKDKITLFVTRFF